jgi:hypothetical protein
MEKKYAKIIYSSLKQEQMTIQKAYHKSKRVRRSETERECGEEQAQQQEEMEYQPIA